VAAQVLLVARGERGARRTAEQLELALEGADLGLWDVRNDCFNHNEVVRRQLGYAPGGSVTRDRRGAISSIATMPSG
jgi:hypothetical protein